MVNVDRCTTHKQRSLGLLKIFKNVMGLEIKKQNIRTLPG